MLNLFLYVYNFLPSFPGPAVKAISKPYYPYWKFTLVQYFVQTTLPNVRTFSWKAGMHTGEKKGEEMQGGRKIGKNRGRGHKD